MLAKRILATVSLEQLTILNTKQRQALFESIAPSELLVCFCYIFSFYFIILFLFNLVVNSANIYVTLSIISIKL